MCMVLKLIIVNLRIQTVSFIKLTDIYTQVPHRTCIIVLRNFNLGNVHIFFFLKKEEKTTTM